MSYNRIEKIKEIIASRRKKTNCFSFFNEICQWFEKGIVNSYLIDKSVFLFLKANGFYKFYYFVDDLEDLHLAKELLDDYKLTSKISLEFTTKNNKGLDEIKNKILPMGFNFHTELARLHAGTNKLKDLSQKEKIIYHFEIANIEDIDELLNIMHQEFDPIKDDIPTKKELLNLVKNNLVSIRRIDNAIVYIQIYEFLKNSLYSRMTWIKKEYRKPKYTVEFFNSTDSYITTQLGIKNFESIKSYFWVDTSIKNYKISLKLGALSDGLTCNIFTYEKFGVE